MRVHVVDPSAYTPPYDHALCSALGAAGADVSLYTSRFAYGPVPSPSGYRRVEHFYRAGAHLPGSSGGTQRARRALKLAEHVPDMLRYRRAARAADVVHFQWLSVQQLDGHLLPRGKPLVLTAHDVLPREPRPGQREAQRRLYERFDAIVAHSAHGRSRLIEELGVDGERVHVIPHGAFAHLAEAPEASDASYAPNERIYQFQSIFNVERSNRRDSLRILADATGGRAILDANDTLPDLTRMRADLASFYSLGFTPAHPSDGREHRLEVRSKAPGVHLRYRQSYRDKTVMEKVVDRTLAALFYGVDDNPLDLTIEVGAPVAEGNLYAVPVQLRIPLFKLAILNQRDDSFKGKLRILVATRDEEGGTSPVRQVEVPLDIPRREVLNAMGQYYLYTLTLKMKAGPQHVAVAVRDELAATSSYLSRPVTVGPVQASAAGHF